MGGLSVVIAVLLLSMLPGASPPVLGAGRDSRFLYLGGSLGIGALCQTPDPSMRSRAFDVNTVVAGGASPFFWLQSHQSLPCSIVFWEVSPHFAEFMKVKPTTGRTKPILVVEKASSRRSSSASAPHPGAPIGGGPEFLEELALRIRLEEKSELRNAARPDYANALGLYEYAVVKDLRGNYPLERIRIAQGVVLGRRLTGAAKAETGSETGLVLVPLSRYTNLESWQTFDDLRPNFEIPICTPQFV